MHARRESGCKVAETLEIREITPPFGAGRHALNKSA